MSKATIAKVLGWVGGFVLYAQSAVNSQSILPHDAKGWLSLGGAIVIGFAFHHASNTDGTK